MALFKRSGTESVSATAMANSASVAHVYLVPVVSEKAARLKNLGQYTFAVKPGISKIEVKKTIEATYPVRVIGVNSVRLPRKTLRRGRTVGHTRIRCHMIVRLAPGQTIDQTPKA